MDDRLAERLRGFGPVGVLALLVILAGNLLFVPLSGLLVLAWAWRSGTPWQELGLVRPVHWPRTVAIGLTSPAYNAGSSIECPASDQRGSAFPRPAAGACDIGAFEAQ